MVHQSGGVVVGKSLEAHGHHHRVLMVMINYDNHGDNEDDDDDDTDDDNIQDRGRGVKLANIVVPSTSTERQHCSTRGVVLGRLYIPQFYH